VGPLLGQVLPLALGAAISPVLFLLQLSTLTGPRPVARGTGLVAGAAIPLLVIGTLGAVAGVGNALSGHATVKAGLDVGLGALLLTLAARTALRAPSAPKPKPERTPSLRRSFVLGNLAMITNVTTFALYIPALKIVAESSVGSLAKVIVTLVVFVLTLSFVLVPLVLAAVVPGSTRFLTALGDAMTRHRRTMSLVLCLGFGTWLVIRGIAAL
jgi:Sap, sulfolipid-1-addressing protein